MSREQRVKAKGKRQKAKGKRQKAKGKEKPLNVLYRKPVLPSSLTGEGEGGGDGSYPATWMEEI
jgi:hypothetical protein